ncbi:hypothetical protein [Paenibacillus sp. GP183]|uniref:hypothetical protein n=1 Tax=Paenibacillus sp. GP183 TaxID=1882751 RepID=UPI00089A7A32|nr:hypothetical protein [Paenibacillus sp. GP183]SEB41531.1 hypothetical protein SAMN05443246_0148 [Paenibacillus sp. GP183]
MNKKWFALSIAAVVSMTTLTGCTDSTKIKQAVDQALVKQNEIKSSSYNGSLTLSLGDGLLAATNPLMNGLLGMAKESNLDWNGAVNKEPLQLETDLTFTPKGSSTGTSIPVLIKDSKLYFNMPAINKPDEYYSVDLQQISKDSKSALNVDSLKNTSQVTTALAKLLLDGIDAKWYKEAKDPLKLKDGASAKSISIEISKKNEQALNTWVQSKLPEFIQTLQTNGLMTAAQADQFKNGSSKSLKIDAPGMLTFAIDDQGYIRDQVMDLSFSIANATGNTVSSKVNLHQSVDGINQTPAFKKEIPKNVKSFNDVLKLLGTAPKAK